RGRKFRNGPIAAQRTIHDREKTPAHARIRHTLATPGQTARNVRSKTVARIMMHPPPQPPPPASSLRNRPDCGENCRFGPNRTEAAEIPEQNGTEIEQDGTGTETETGQDKTERNRTGRTEQ